MMFLKKIKNIKNKLQERMQLAQILKEHRLYEQGNLKQSILSTREKQR
ncbi:MAG: hypothetical protein MJ158_02485 [Alphaproteobacteria bacterium]|nr:hypothetical protein [Alphaproteobacteria bacterium]